MCILSVKEAEDGLAKANGMRRRRHVLRRPNDDILRRVLRYGMEGKQKRGRPKKTRNDKWKRKQ